MESACFSSGNSKCELQRLRSRPQAAVAAMAAAVTARSDGGSGAKRRCCLPSLPLPHWLPAARELLLRLEVSSLGGCRLWSVGFVLLRVDLRSKAGGCVGCVGCCLFRFVGSCSSSGLLDSVQSAARLGPDVLGAGALGGEGGGGRGGALSYVLRQLTARPLARSLAARLLL